MLKWGLEKEFFLLDAENKPYVIQREWSLPFDECGWLVEARGNPFYNIIDAVFSLKAEIYKIEQTLVKVNESLKATVLHLDDCSVCKVDRKARVLAARSYGKPPIKYQNFYGHDHHKNAITEATAGVHISITDPVTITRKDGTDYTYHPNFDWPQIFLTLDREFKEEIKAAKRQPGFYEMKQDGRVEYRSLPSNVDLDKVIKVLSKFGGCYYG
jgi:hypothetical protein